METARNEFWNQNYDFILRFESTYFIESSFFQSFSYEIAKNKLVSVFQLFFFIFCGRKNVMTVV